MNDSMVMDLGQKALYITFMVCAPILGFGLVVGLVVSIFQAATQIHEATLSFIPKILAIVVALVLFGPWMLRMVTSFSINLLQSIPSMVK